MKWLMFLLLVLNSNFLAAKELPDYKADKIAADTYVIHGPAGMPSPQNQGFMNNPVFVLTSEGVVVIDPGSSLYTGRMVLRQIRKLTDRPVTHVLSTHIHGDHWLGNQAFKDLFPKAVFMAHPNMITQAKAGADKQWLDLMSTLTKGATDGTTAVIPDIEVDEAASFKTGGKTFRILAPKRAHSGTDIMVHIVEENVLALGDNVFHKRIGRMDDATFRGNINACDVAIKLGVKVYVPGHGPTGDVKVVKKFRTYLSTLYETVKVLLDEGMSDYEMKPKVVAKLKAYHQWNGFHDQVGKHVSLAMLEAEKAGFE
ncbi:MAG: MBL fold metallo-hydrolase [Gammaproteobacteria bacterium]|nr:MBL fold metallo-hydrolase [Gammaproteobacteria bacterium]MDH5653758.1 MBL fold metallo-hydrolase [Gammaproteobacteria bacterium]